MFIVEFGTRKIQQNKYTYMVPLPPLWIKSMGLQQGDCVRIELTEEQNLKIVPANARQDITGTNSNAKGVASQPATITKGARYG